MNWNIFSNESGIELSIFVKIEYGVKGVRGRLERVENIMRGIILLLLKLG